MVLKYNYIFFGPIMNNFTISKLSLQLILSSPFISQTKMYENSLSSTFFQINCFKSSYSFLYSKSIANINFMQSNFIKFNGQCPIFISSELDFFQKSKNSILLHNLIRKKENDEGKSEYYQETFASSLFFYSFLDLSVTINECQFIDCINMYSQGGAISFRKSTASLIIDMCTFLRCKSYQSSGAIYVLQLAEGFWLIGDLHISHSDFEECNDCNNDINHDYVAGVIEASIAKGDNSFSFKLSDSRMLNCEFDKPNKITEAQIRLSANIFHVEYFNISNSVRKVDLSAIFFNKYVQLPSSITFLNAFNQYGFTFFELYDIEDSYIEVSEVNFINTTFVNYDKHELLTKIAFFNIYTSHDNSLYINNIFIIDFRTIITGEIDLNFSLVDPVIIQIPLTCRPPITWYIISNQHFNKTTNKVNYIYYPSMKYDFENEIFIGMPEIISETPIDISSSFVPTSSYIYNYIFENINHYSEKSKMRLEIIVVISIVALIVIINVIVILVIAIKTRNNIGHSTSISEDEDDEEKDDQINQNKIVNLNGQDNSIHQSYLELFYNPKKNTKEKEISKSKDLISNLLENDPFKDDIEEIERL